MPIILCAIGTAAVNVLRLVAHERGLLVSALVPGGAEADIRIPVDFVIFALLLGFPQQTGVTEESNG